MMGQLPFLDWSSWESWSNYCTVQKCQGNLKRVRGCFQLVNNDGATTKVKAELCKGGKEARMETKPCKSEDCYGNLGEGEESINSCKI